MMHISTNLCIFYNIHILNITQYIIENNIWNSLGYKNVYCNLFSFWIYDKLVTNYMGSTSIANIIYPKIQDIFIQASSLYDKSFHPICQLDSKMTKYDDWKKAKKLYDYCLDYETVKEMYKPDTENCKEYHEYFDHEKDVYIYFKEYCNSSSGDQCPISDEIFNKCDPEMVLKDHSCITGTTETDNSVMEQSLSIHENNSIEQENKMTKIALFTTFEDPKLGGENPNPLAMLGNIILGGIITSLIFGILYKYTTIGSQLRNIIVNIKKVISYHNKEDSELYTDASDYLKPYYQDPKEHYVGYCVS
ncbi:variable surface protein [Plasmodium gonderi]|uniref:Variable surface protein n=1 Tax=Plasmodium gonderi TaxID=77519 RepID=A0A1Y1JRV3_PLAGO|nr:variable surface protein [Plasmodium gonderi]GAW82734.1 variable surface protein [Plasmodium gonderi]